MRGPLLKCYIKIEFKPGPTVSDTINFNTPIIGLRALWYFDNPWYLNIFGDYGGFDVDGVDQTWQAMAGVGYQFDKFEIVVAYDSHYHHSHDDHGDHYHHCRPIKGSGTSTGTDPFKEECQNHNNEWEPNSGD